MSGQEGNLLRYRYKVIGNAVPPPLSRRWQRRCRMSGTERARSGVEVMADRFSSAARDRVMSRIKQRDTAPEMALWRALGCGASLSAEAKA